jgi:hypothetical protein
VKTALRPPLITIVAVVVVTERPPFSLVSVRRDGAVHVPSNRCAESTYKSCRVSAAFGAFGFALGVAVETGISEIGAGNRCDVITSIAAIINTKVFGFMVLA